MKRNLKKPAFTVLELTFAIVVIGVMMAIVLSTIIGMLRFYSFASTVRVNQAAGRQVMDDIDRQIRFSTIITPTKAVPTANKICVADTKNQILYSYEAVGTAVQKTTYSYSGSTIPTNCAVGGSVTQTAQGNITPTTMKVAGLSFTRTAGAPIASNTDAAAVVITMPFVNGTPDPATGKCRPGDIYCSALQFSTAVNIRNGGQ